MAQKQGRGRERHTNPVKGFGIALSQLGIFSIYIHSRFGGFCCFVSVLFKRIKFPFIPSFRHSFFVTSFLNRYASRG